MTTLKIFRLPIIVLVIIGIGVIGFLLAKPQKHGTIRIGWIGALSGTATQWGEPALKAAALRVEKINSRGGVDGKQIELLVEDSKSDAKTAVTAAQKLIGIDRVNIILTHSSTESVAVAPLAESNHVLMFASASSVPELSQAGDYIFRLTPVNKEGEAIADKLNKNNIQTIGIIYEDAKYPIPIKDAIKKYYAGSLILEESFTPSNADFRTIALKLKTKHPDAVVILPFGVDQGLSLTKEIVATGLPVTIYGNAVFDTPTALTELSSIPQEVFFSTLFIDETSNEIIQFKKRYQEQYGSEIPVLAHTLDAVTKVDLITEGIAACRGINIECLKQFLYRVKDKKTISGIISIDEFGDTDKPFVVKKITKGSAQIVD